MRPPFPTVGLLLLLAGCASRPAATSPPAQPRPNSAMGQPEDLQMGEEVTRRVVPAASAWELLTTEPLEISPNPSDLRGGNVNVLFTRLSPSVEDPSHNAPPQMLFRRQGTDRAWSVDRFEGASDHGTPSSTNEYRLDAEGSVGITQSVVRDDNVITKFDPPLLALPAGLTQGEPRVQKLHMSVHPLDHPEKIRMQGDATQEVTLVGEDLLRIRGQELRAIHIRAVLKASLGLPQVMEQNDSWYVPGQGLVGEKTTERVKTLGITVRSSDEHWVIAEPTPAQPKAATPK